MTRRLALRREALAELATGDLRLVHGGGSAACPVSVLTNCVACPDVVPVTRLVSALVCTLPTTP